MARQNRYAEAIVAGTATDAVIKKPTTYAQLQGELAYATDTGFLYIGNSNTTGGGWSLVNIGLFAKVLSINDEVVLLDDELVLLV